MTRSERAQDIVLPTLRPYASGDGATGFECEQEPLNVFFRRYAGQQSGRDENRTWVLPRPEDRPDLPALLGFYTITTASLERSSLPAAVTKRLPDYPIRGFLIGRLARDLRCRGLGIGEYLLDDAHRRALRGSADFGGFFVVVDAKDVAAARFYLANDYTPLLRSQEPPELWPRRFYVLMKDLRLSYPSSGSPGLAGSL